MAANQPIPQPQPAPTPSLDAKLTEFDNVPLFMQSLPEGATEDPALAALQNLAYEGTPDGG